MSNDYEILSSRCQRHHFYMIAMVYNLSHSYFRYYSLRLMAPVLVTSWRFHVQEYPSSHDDRGSRTRALSYTGNEACLSIPDNCYILSGAWCLSGVASSWQWILFIARWYMNFKCWKKNQSGLSCVKHPPVNIASTANYQQRIPHYQQGGMPLKWQNIETYCIFAKGTVWLRLTRHFSLSHYPDLQNYHYGPFVDHLDDCEFGDWHYGEMTNEMCQWLWWQFFGLLRGGPKFRDYGSQRQNDERRGIWQLISPLSEWTSIKRLINRGGLILESSENLVPLS